MEVPYILPSQYRRSGMLTCRGASFTIFKSGRTVLANWYNPVRPGR